MFSAYLDLKEDTILLEYGASFENKMGFFDFIKDIFEELDDSIIVSGGRAACKVCEKKLDGRVYEIKGHKGYFCKKHAKQVLKNIRNHEKEESIITVDVVTRPDSVTHKPTKRPYPGYCEFKSCKNKPKGIDIYFCIKCYKYHCPKHRIAEDHNCSGKLTILDNESTISYSR